MRTFAFLSFFFFSSSCLSSFSKVFFPNVNFVDLEEEENVEISLSPQLQHPQPSSSITSFNNFFVFFFSLLLLSSNDFLSERLNFFIICNFLLIMLFLLLLPLPMNSHYNLHKGITH